MGRRRLASTPTIRCPVCREGRIIVTDTRHRPASGYIWRRRECVACGWRFSTKEEIAAMDGDSAGILDVVVLQSSNET